MESPGRGRTFIQQYVRLAYGIYEGHAITDMMEGRW